MGAISQRPSRDWKHSFVSSFPVLVSPFLLQRLRPVPVLVQIKGISRGSDTVLCLLNSSSSSEHSVSGRHREQMVLLSVCQCFQLPLWILLKSLCQNSLRREEETERDASTSLTAACWWGSGGRLAQMIWFTHSMPFPGHR